MNKDESKFNAFLGPETSYNGQLSFAGSVRIDGEFSGEITAEGTLILGTSAKVSGRINVAQLILSGKIDGEIFVSKQTTMHKTAFLTGNIMTPILVMEEGAILQGSVQMTKDPLPEGTKFRTVPNAQLSVSSEEA
ncbi:MAG: polymer-forming cytoskeletal protein [Deltaproteobacteria bacterium]|jgi:cytoskeletal protein CcmA (bactofilin family)|nr:polymer-forming cytoskeletal protein [Deltaproteobacteria bacterium]